MTNALSLESILPCVRKPASTLILSLLAIIASSETLLAKPSERETIEYIDYVIENYAAIRDADIRDVRGGISNESDKLYFVEVYTKSDSGRRSNYFYEAELTKIGWIRARNTNSSTYSQAGDRCDAISAKFICRYEGCVERTYSSGGGTTSEGLVRRYTDDVDSKDYMRIYFCESDWQEFTRLTRALDHLANLWGASGIEFINEVVDMDKIGESFD